MGEFDINQVANIRLCMLAVIQFVAVDLEDACKNDTVCLTLSALLEIFDETTGYQEIDVFLLRRKIRDTKLIVHLGQYLYKLASCSFGNCSDNELRSGPSIPSIQSVVTCLRIACSCEYAPFGKSSVVVARSAMTYLLSLSDDVLVGLGDDIIDVCTKAEVIYRRETVDSMYHIYDCMFEFLELKRELVLKLVTKSSVSSKLLGFAMIEKICEINTEFRPYPATYIVSGAGDEGANGRYEIDNVLYNGRLGNDSFQGIRYVKKEPGNQEDGIYYQLAWLPAFGWTMSKNRYDAAEKTVLYLSGRHDSNFRFKRPLEKGWNTKKGTLPIPKIEQAGFVLVTGMKATFEHDLIDWIIQNDILEQVATDVKSIHRDFRRDATKALKCMMTTIKELSNSISGNHLTTQLCRNYNDNVLNDTERDKNIINSIIQHLKKDIGEDTKETIGDDLITKLCDDELVTLRNIIRTAWLHWSEH